MRLKLYNTLLFNPILSSSVFLEYLSNAEYIPDDATKCVLQMGVNKIRSGSCLFDYFRTCITTEFRKRQMGYGGMITNDELSGCLKKAVVTYIKCHSSINMDRVRKTWTSC
jgi:hypothetical protein